MNRHVITQLNSDNDSFPDPATALDEPNGLLAIGGDLSPHRLLQAYRNGIFPWSAPHQALLWWSPNPRAVLKPADLHINRSLRKFIRRIPFTITVNHCFNDVINACSAPRRTSSSTWISQAMIDAYQQLHQLGYAHSIEIWLDGELQAGLYGLSIGQLFCGESMFSYIDNGSKLAMVALCHHFGQHGGSLIDCQMQNPFLLTLGVQEWPRDQFLQALSLLITQPLTASCWQKQAIMLCPLTTT